MSADTRETLRARARALAQEPAREEADAESLQVVEFLLASEHYAVEMTHLCEVYPVRELTPVPCTPPFVAGMVNVRGRILIVIDLKEFFGLPRQEPTGLHTILIVEAGDTELGLLADSVVGARAVSRHELQPAPPTLTGIGAEYLRGVTPEPLVVLDVAAILADERIVVQEEVEA